MHTFKAVLALGAVLSTGALLAAAQDAEAPASGNAAQASQTQSQADAGMDRHHAKGEKRDPDKMVAHLAKKLNLSADQQAQLKPILAERQQQMQALRADTSMSKEDRRAKAQQIHQESKAKIEAVLNAQQKQQFEQMMAERRAHHKEHKQGE